MATQAVSARLRVRVVPGSRGGEGIERHGDRWKIRVAAAPERGAANAAATALLADALAVPRRRVTLETGFTAREKVVRVDGIAPDEVDARLAAAVEVGAR